jgi:hypothetical protein
MPRRQPRKPSIGLNSCSCSTRCSGCAPRARRSSSPAPPAAPQVCGRNSCSGGSRKRIVAGIALQRRKMPAKSSRWYGSSLASALPSAPRASRRGSSRASRRCGRRRRTCARCGTGRCRRRRTRRRSRPAPACRRWCGRHADRVVAPLHQLLEVLELLGLLRRLRRRRSALRRSRRRGLDLAGVDLAGRAVDRHPVAFLEVWPSTEHRLRLVVDFERAGAADADLAHLRATSAACDDTPPRAVRMPSAAIMPRRSSGRRLDADEQHLLALVRRGRRRDRR